ncbi:MAG: hypothetical protein R3E86_11380 [Pseudomonadales bacterium]
MPDLISSDFPLTASQRTVLTAVLDTLLPASRDGEMPSAAEVDFTAYLVDQAEGFVAELAAILDELTASFADLPAAARHERLTEFSAGNPAPFRNLLTRVYDCYYQNDLVRTRIGVTTGAPFPAGNDVIAGDLSLLDPVIANSTRHRFRKPG